MAGPGDGWSLPRDLPGQPRCQTPRPLLPGARAAGENSNAPLPTGYLGKNASPLKFHDRFEFFRRED